MRAASHADTDVIDNNSVDCARKCTLADAHFGALKQNRFMVKETYKTRSHNT